MIQANELRIGNWAYGTMYPNQPLQIKTLHETIVHLGEHLNGYDTLQPIPLTPEILEKCGFEIYTENTGAPINEDIEYYSNQIDVFFDVHGSLIIKDYHYNINRPKHLHQLQNLYFALTGEELTFKP